ncbi:MAG TPA: peptidase M20, partial [Planctomycetaceae bacterium]|nr:peptidase M20 [Planctomycetaceae bacterium]
MLKLDTYLQENRDKFEEELSDFLRIPSISADSRFGQEMGRASEWVANQFKNM